MLLRWIQLRWIQITTKQVADNPNNKQEKQEQQGGENCHKPSKLDTNPQLNLQKELQRQGCKKPQHSKGGKASTQPAMAAKHPSEAITNKHDDGGNTSTRVERRQSIRQRRGVAKHPPDDDQRNPDDADETERRQA
jgi:hypothetical protein